MSPELRQRALFVGYCARMISTVAVGTDGNLLTAEEAVKQAADLARRYGAKLVIAEAPSGAREGESTGTGKDIELQWASSSQARVRTILERSEEALRASGDRVRDAARRG